MECSLLRKKTAVILEESLDFLGRVFIGGKFLKRGGEKLFSKKFFPKVSDGGVECRIKRRSRR